MKRILLAGAFLTLFVGAGPAFATAPGDACAPALDGKVRQDDGYILVCDGSNWQAVAHVNTLTKNGYIMFSSGGDAAAPLHVWGEAILGAQGLSCAGSTEGGLRYLSASDLWQYCDGASWADLASGSGSGIAVVTGEPAPTFTYMLDDLTDVNAGAPSGGECLTWSGTEWANGACGAALSTVTGQPAPTFNFVLDDLSDVDAAGPNNGDVMYYSAGASGWTIGALTTTASPAGADREIQFNSGGSLSADSNFVFTSAGFLGIGTATPASPLHLTSDSPDVIFNDTGTDNATSFYFQNDGVTQTSLNAYQGSSPYIHLKDNTATEVGFIVGRDTLRGDYRFSIAGNSTRKLMWRDFGAGWNAAKIEVFKNSGSNNKGTMLIQTAGHSIPQLFLDDAGAVGVGTLTPVTQLDVAGAVKVDYDAATCDGTIAGAIRYDSGAPSLDYCDGSVWQTIANGGSTGLWTDNGTHISYQSAHFLKAGETMTSAGFDGGMGSALVWNKDKSALRAGYVNGSQWNEANTGDYSVAFGYNNTVASWASLAVGEANVITGGVGGSGIAMGRMNTLTFGGSNATIAMGFSNSAVGDGSVALGNTNSVTNHSGYAIGRGNSADGNNMALGRYAKVTGNGSIAFGATNADPATDPVVSGADSIGFFLGDQSGVDVAQSNAFVIMGGKVGIGTTSPSVELNVIGDIEYTGMLNDVSDRRLKTDIVDLPAGQIEKLLALNGVTFKMKNDSEGRTEIGLIAQDVELVYPELVRESGSGVKSLNYTGLIAPIIEALREQQALIAAQTTRIDDLEAALSAQTTLNENLEARLLALEMRYGTGEATE
ncbi:MAG: tail fiber domain-containing protein [Rhodospirillales bacterium]|nr:tail fiber domain-containing protein [Rhodospirillales bacterium]